MAHIDKVNEIESNLNCPTWFWAEGEAYNYWKSKSLCWVLGAVNLWVFWTHVTGNRTHDEKVPPNASLEPCSIYYGRVWLACFCVVCQPGFSIWYKLYWKTILKRRSYFIINFFIEFFLIELLVQKLWIVDLTTGKWLSILTERTFSIDNFPNLFNLVNENYQILITFRFRYVIFE